MLLSELVERYSDLRKYVGWRTDDAARIQTIAQTILYHRDQLIDDFYREIQRHPHAAKVIAGGHEQIERLKRSLANWLDDLFSGDYEAEYVSRRWQVGRKHVEIGLDQIYASAALARLRCRMTEILAADHSLSPEELSASIQSLNKLLDLDLAIIEQAYQSEYLARLHPVAEARMRQQSAVAHIGERALFSTDIASLMDRAVVMLADTLRSQRCEILEFQPSHHQLLLRSGYGWPVDLVGNKLIEITADSHVGAAIRASEPVVVADFRDEDCYQPHDSGQKDGVLSGMCTVVRGEHAHWGVLCVYWNSPRTFVDSDVDFLQSVANVLAAAIERKDAEDRIREREQIMRRMVEHLPAGAAYVSMGRIHLNRAVESMTGYEREELSTLDQWFNKLYGNRAHEIRDIYERDRAAHFPHSTNTKIIRRDGTERVLEFTGYQSGEDEVWLIHDVTDIQNAQERAVRAERLATIGQMITGLAHESRNALQRIQACTEMLEFEIEGNVEATELIRRMQRAQDDLQRLFNEVRNYAAPIQIESCSCQLDRVWNEAWATLEPDRRDRNAKLVEHTDGVDLKIHVDRFRMGQVFRNFFENSLAACKDPVRICISCEECRLGGKSAVRVTVHDNGPGLSQQARSRLFEPFFTTKTKGTGLGMAIAQRNVDAHGGMLDVGSCENGAQFVITIPRHSS